MVIPMNCSEYIPMEAPMNSNGERVVELTGSSAYSAPQSLDFTVIEVSYGLEAVRVMTIPRNLLVKITSRSMK